MENLMIMIAGMVWAFLTYKITVCTSRGAVFASASVTLAAGVLLPAIMGVTGTKLATVIACASYGGMISPKWIAKPWELVVIGGLSALVFILAEEAFKGVGGKLGTMAAIACLAWIGIKALVNSVSEKKKAVAAEK